MLVFYENNTQKTPLFPKKKNQNLSGKGQEVPRPLQPESSGQPPIAFLSYHLFYLYSIWSLAFHRPSGSGGKRILPNPVPRPARSSHKKALPLPI